MDSWRIPIHESIDGAGWRTKDGACRRTKDGAGWSKNGNGAEAELGMEQVGAELRNNEGFRRFKKSHDSRF